MHYSNRVTRGFCYFGCKRRSCKTTTEWKAKSVMDNATAQIGENDTDFGSLFINITFSTTSSSSSSSSFYANTTTNQDEDYLPDWIDILLASFFSFFIVVTIVSNFHLVYLCLFLMKFLIFNF